MRGINEIIIHCSGTRSGSAKAYRKYHCSLGWDDIGYHKIINRDGSISEGRPLQIVGAHCKGYNENSIGICLTGNSSFTIGQLETLRSLVYGLEFRFDKDLKVTAHNEYNTGKTCPNMDGDILRSYIRTNKYLNRLRLKKTMKV